MSLARDGILPGDVTDDAFLGGRLGLLQPRKGYRAGLDAVLLAASAPLDPLRAERVLDVGSGVGTVGLCVAARHSDARLVLLERDAGLAALAEENARRNALAARVRVVRGDVLSGNELGVEMGLADASFDHVLANPPYHGASRGTRSNDARKHASHAMNEHDLARWVRFLARMSAPGGTATLIHKAEALGDILDCMKGRFGGLAVLPIHPRPTAAATRVIVQGRKGSRAPLTLLAGFVLHGAGHSFTPAAEAILRHGEGLDLGRSGGAATVATPPRSW